MGDESTAAGPRSVFLAAVYDPRPIVALEDDERNHRATELVSTKE